jgi:hypothetical protein
MKNDAAACDGTSSVFQCGKTETIPGTVNFNADIGGITEIANFNFTGFAGWHRLHHDGGIADYQLEAARGSPP